MSPGDKPPQRPVFSLAEARSSIQALENLADIACRCTSPFRIVTEDSPSTTSPARLRISPALETAQFSGLRHSCNALPRSFVCRSCKRLLEYAGHTPSRIRWALEGETGPCGASTSDTRFASTRRSFSFPRWVPILLNKYCTILGLFARILVWVVLWPSVAC